MSAIRRDQETLVTASAALVFVVPMVVDPWALDPYLPLRFLLLTGALLVGLGAAVRRDGPGRVLGRIPPPLLLSWTGLLVIALAAAARAPVPSESLLGDAGRRFGALSVLLLFAAFLLGGAVADRLGRLLRLGPVLITALVAAMLPEVVAGTGGGVAVLVGNAGQLGAYLVLLLGAAAVVARHDPVPGWRRAAGASLPFGVGALLLTGSHAAVVAVAALVLAWLVSGALGGLPQMARAGMAVVAVLLLVVALLWVDRFRVLVESWQGRTATWSVAWGAFLDRPWLGWGPDGFRHGFAAHVPAEFVSRYGDDRITDRAHTIVMEPLVALGVIGGAGVVLLVGLYLRYRVREDAISRGTGRALFAMAVFLLAWFPEVEIAAMMSLLAGATTREALVGVRTGSSGTTGTGRWTRPMLVSVLGLGLLTTLVGATAGVVADREVRGQLQALRSGEDPAANPVLPAAGPWSGVTALLIAVPAVRAESDPDVLRRARDAVAEPHDAERTTLYADLSATIARTTADRAELRRSVSAYEQALELAPNHSVAWLGLGELLLAAGDTRAGPALQRAATLRPGDVAPRANLAFLAAARGERDAAVAHLQDACALAPSDPQLVQLAVELGREPTDLGCRG